MNICSHFTALAHIDLPSLHQDTDAASSHMEQSKLLLLVGDLPRSWFGSLSATWGAKKWGHTRYNIVNTQTVSWLLYSCVHSSLKYIYIYIFHKLNVSLIKAPSCNIFWCQYGDRYILSSHSQRQTNKDKKCVNDAFTARVLCSLWPCRPLTLSVITLLRGHVPSGATPQFPWAPLESSHGLQKTHVDRAWGWYTVLWPLSPVNLLMKNIPQKMKGPLNRGCRICG